jgi:hypothetical protein
MWAWRRYLRGERAHNNLAFTGLGVRNVTQLARCFRDQTVLSLKVREVRQIACKPAIEAVKYGG